MKCVGLRDPNSKDRNSVFVGEYKFSGLCHYAVFHDGKDYVGLDTVLAVTEKYYHYYDKGWLPMTADDIKQTSGMTGTAVVPWRNSTKLCVFLSFVGFLGFAIFKGLW